MTGDTTLEPAHPDAERKPYIKPTLQEFGTVRSTTNKLDMSGSRDGGASSSKT
jgi:hypothetical protein